MFTRIVLALFLIAAIPYYWLLMDPGPTEVHPRQIDIARLRTLAASQNGPLPTAIQYAAVATDTEPGTILVAGGGLKSEHTAVLVWRLATPGGDTIINSGLTDDQAEASGYEDYHSELQATVDNWLGTARRIIFTSEEIDHVGGLLAFLPARPALASKVIGNPDQLNAIHALAPVLTTALRPSPASLTEPMAYGALAPGIAAVRTPGHLAGTQMIYVRLQNGREYLFAGDAAPMRRNVAWLRPRSRYAAEWRGTEDRGAALAWIKGLAQVKAREPHLTIVYGHDLGWLADPVAGPHIPAAPAMAVPSRDQPATR